MSTRISQLTAATSLDGSELIEIVQSGTSKRVTAQQVSRLAAELYAATSTTSLAIGTGSKSLTTQTYLAYRGGAFVTLSDANNPDTNYMSGIVTSYAPTTGAMTVNVTVVAGSGTIANWNIQPSGTQGAQGDPGAPWNGWQGAWLTATAYVINDAVDNDGASYICTVDHTSGASSEPGTGASWASYWDVLAEKGDTGTAATISVGTVTTGAAGSSASVTNVGTSSAAVFNFAIPRGDTGAAWDAWQGAWLTATAYALNDAVENGGSSYICTQAHTSGAASEPGTGGSWTSYWDVIAEKGADGAGAGDVVGPASATNNGFAKFDGTTGKLLKDGAATVEIGSEVSGLGTGVATFLGTPSSANLAAAVTDETGSGALVFAMSPTLVTPALGTPSSVTLTNATGLPIATGVSGLGTGIATFLATPSSANLAAAVYSSYGVLTAGVGVSSGARTSNTATLNAMAASNAVIILPEGWYETDGEIVVSGATHIVGNAKTTIQRVGGGGVTFRITSSDAALIGFCIDGGVTNQYVAGHIGVYGNNTTYGANWWDATTIGYLSNIQLLGLTITNFGEDGIRFDFLQASRISRCKVQWCGVHGIFVAGGSSDIVIDDNDVGPIRPGRMSSSSAWYGTYSSRGSWSAASGSFPSGSTAGYWWTVSVAGTVDGVTFLVGDRIAAKVNSASTSTYSGNWTKVHAASYGIAIARDQRLVSHVPVPRYIRITNNRVSDVSGWNGIDLHGASNTIISGNVVKRCSVGIHLEDGDAGNYVGTWNPASGSFPSGAGLKSSYQASGSGTVDGQSFVAGDYLIAKIDSPSTTTYAGNWLKTTASEIHVAARSVQIATNHIVSNVGTEWGSSTGININGAATNGDDTFNVSVVGNYMEYCGSNGGIHAAATRGAIHVYDGSGITVTGNIMEWSYGVASWWDNSTGGVFSNNIVRHVESVTHATLGALQVAVFMIDGDVDLVAVGNLFHMVAGYGFHAASAVDSGFEWKVAISNMMVGAATLLGSNVSFVDSETVVASTFNARLSLTTGTPVSATDESGTTLYLTPYNGQLLALYVSGAWTYVTLSSDASLSTSGLSDNTNHDIFCYSNAGTPTLEAVAWTNDSTRATALALQNGIDIKSGDATRRYVGTIRTTTSGTVVDSAAKRFVWNRNNRVLKDFSSGTITGTHTYTTGSWRQWNSDTTAQVAFVVGASQRSLFTLDGDVKGDGTNAGYVAFGFDTTSGGSTPTIRNYASTNLRASAARVQPFAAGYHYTAAVEFGATGHTCNVVALFGTHEC